MKMSKISSIWYTRDMSILNLRKKFLTKNTYETRQSIIMKNEIVTIAVNVHSIELTAQLGDGWSRPWTWIWRLRWGLSMVGRRGPHCWQVEGQEIWERKGVLMSHGNDIQQLAKLNQPVQWARGKTTPLSSTWAQNQSCSTIPGSMVI